MPLLVALAIGVVTSLILPEALQVMFPGPAPKIVCTIDGRGLVNATLNVGSGEEKSSKIFWIQNAGNASAGSTTIFVYMNYKEESPFLKSAWDPDESEWCESRPIDDPRYDAKLFVGEIEEFHAGGKYDFRFVHFLNISAARDVPAMLKFFYNGPKPMEIPFTMRLTPKTKK